MTTQDFDGRLRELSALVGSDQAMELFNQEYEAMVIEVKALPGPRYEMFKRMKEVLTRQAVYLVGGFIREKVKTGPFMAGNA